MIWLPSIDSYSWHFTQFAVNLITLSVFGRRHPVNTAKHGAEICGVRKATARGDLIGLAVRLCKQPLRLFHSDLGEQLAEGFARFALDQQREI